MIRYAVAALCALAAACSPGGETAQQAAQTGANVASASTTERLVARVKTPQDNLSAEQRAELEGILKEYLDNYATNLAAGFSPAAGLSDEIAPLQPLEEHAWTVNLEQGARYRILGACDNECDNVDLRLIDPSGREVASDVMADDYPLVNITPPASGPYVVRIVLKTCTIGPCYVAARVLRQS